MMHMSFQIVSGFVLLSARIELAEGGRVFREIELDE